MPTLTKRGSGTPVTSGTTWTTTTNAVDGTPPANPATYAVWTSSTSGATGYIEISGYDFSAIPANAVINSVTATLRHFENNVSRIPTVTFQAYVGATPLGTLAQTTESTTARDDASAFPVTLAQLQGGTFKMRATAIRAAVTQSATFNVDHIDVTVNYTVEEKSGGSTGIINVPADGSGRKTIASGVTSLVGATAEGAGVASGVDAYYVIFRRTPPTGLPFDPNVDTPIGNSGLNEIYVDENLANGTYEYQVFGWDGAEWTFGSALVTATVSALVGGATVTVQVAANAGGKKNARGAFTEVVQVDGEGSGTTARRGGSEANVNVDSTGSGVEKTRGGSTALVGVDAEAAGRKVVSRGATTFPKVDAEAAGRKQSRSGSTELIGVDAEGAGTAFIPATGTGGSTAPVQTNAQGAGRKAIAGGSTAHIGVDTEGEGTPGAIVGGNGRPKVWTGSAWVEYPAKVWNGSTWVEKPMKVWTGSEWEKV